MRVALVRRSECVPKRCGSRPMSAIHSETRRAYCLVVMLGGWTVQRLAFAVGRFLVVIVLLRDLRGPARVPRDHGSLALFFPSAGHSFATGCLCRPVTR